MKKRIYIDVDGVLNFDDPCEGSIDVPLTIGEKSGIVRLNVNHGPWLLELADSTDSELWWGTSWQDNANEYIAPYIGLPELPVLHFGPLRFSQSNGSWKSNAVLEKFEKDSVPFLWFDDDFTIPRYLARIPESTAIVRLVEGRSGISREDIDFAHKWLSMINWS